MSHFLAAHSSVVGVSPKITPGILLVHFREALSRGGPDVSQSRNLAPAHSLVDAPLEFFFGRAEFLFKQIGEQHGTFRVEQCLTIQFGNRGRQHYIQLLTPASLTIKRRDESQSR